MKPRHAIVAVVIALGLASTARADDAPAPTKVAVFDLRPIRSNGQTDLSLLRDAVRLTGELRERLEAVTDATVVDVKDLKALLGPLYRVNVFDCRESPACLQRTMLKLSKKGIKRAVVGTYEVVNDRAQLTLHGIDTATGAFTKVELFESVRGAEPDEDGASRVMLSVAGVPKKGGEPKPEEPKPEEPTPPEGDTTDVLSPSPPPPPPRVPDRIQVLGWGRSHTAYGLNSQGSDPLAAPYDKVVSHNAFYLAARYQRSKTFEATASGLLEYDVFDHRTAYEPQIREMYIGVFSDHAGLRIGNQRIAWGKGDVISPNDVLNPRDLRDPLLTDTELRHIPTFAVRADFESGSNALQLVFQPFFVPDRYDVYGSNWAAIQPDSPLAYRGFFHLIDQLFDTTLHDQVQRVFAQTSLPTKPSAGARYTVTGHNVDASLYYHYGYDSSPKVTLDPNFAAAIGSVDWTMATPSTLAPVLGLLDMGVTPYSVEFQRRHHIGFDGVTTIGSFALKVDAAYDTKHVYYQPDLVSFVSPAAQAVVSLEYQTGEIGKLILLEGVYNRIMDTPPMIGLLGYNKDTEGVALLARWTFFDVIETEVRAVYEDSPHTTVFQPQIAYRARSGGLSIGAGALFIKGDGSSLGAYYGRNDSVYGLVKYAF